MEIIQVAYSKRFHILFEVIGMLRALVSFCLETQKSRRSDAGPTVGAVCDRAFFLVNSTFSRLLRRCAVTDRAYSRANSAVSRQKLVSVLIPGSQPL
jgi:hypothetical protein